MLFSSSIKVEEYCNIIPMELLGTCRRSGGASRGLAGPSLGRRRAPRRRPGCLRLCPPPPRTRQRASCVCSSTSWHVRVCSASLRLASTIAISHSMTPAGQRSTLPSSPSS